MPNIQNMANAIRFLAIDSILNAGEGHQGVPLGMAEIAATLYANHLKADPNAPQWHDRDRVVLSNGHGSMLLYALLHLSGYPHMDINALKSFRKIGSVCAGHPEIEQHAGIEITTGLLGQGIACAVGMAVAEERLAAQFGPSRVDHRTWAFVGDGCLQEGIGQEAISLAGHLKLGKLTFLWDDNQITDDGDTALSISEDIPARFRAAGWHVQIVDGHDITAIDRAIDVAKGDDRPSLIACRTTIARGIPRLQGQRGGHSAPLTAQDRAKAAYVLGWDEPSFAIPKAIYDDFRSSMTRGQVAHSEWKDRLNADHDATEYHRWMASQLPTDWTPQATEIIEKMANITAPHPTILASGDVVDELAKRLPETIVLCADLEAPTNHKRSRHAFTAHDRTGSYVHCGVREHVMGAMCDGIAAHGGLRPINVTYLAFADYERPAMRMAALMQLPVPFVFSHDSIGVGSNGPTHQPVEILASFRAMPNINVYRPADAIETAELWLDALSTDKTPAVFALSRQAAHPVRTTFGENLAAMGGYILMEPQAPRDITIIATGTETALAVDAAHDLANQGINAAVVSLPCWELFEAQAPDYQASVLGTAPRIAIEAAMEFGWGKWLRRKDAFIGMDSFGASARAEVLYEHFGITAQAIVSKAKDILTVN